MDTDLKSLAWEYLKGLWVLSLTNLNHHFAGAIQTGIACLQYLFFLDEISIIFLRAQRRKSTFALVLAFSQFDSIRSPMYLL